MPIWDYLKKPLPPAPPETQLDDPHMSIREMTFIQREIPQITHLSTEQRLARIAQWPHTTMGARTLITNELLKIALIPLTFIVEFGPGIRVLDDQAIVLEAQNSFSNFIANGGNIPTYSEIIRALSNAYNIIRNHYIYINGPQTPFQRCYFFALANRRIRRMVYVEREVFNLANIDKFEQHYSKTLTKIVPSMEDDYLNNDGNIPADQVALEQLCMTIHRGIIDSDTFEKYLRFRNMLFHTRRIPYERFLEAI